MRAFPAALALLAIVTAPAVGAQLGGPTFQLMLKAPSDPIPPGGQAGLLLHLERTCPNAAGTMDPQRVDITFLGEGRATVDGPAQVAFPGQTCAIQPTAVVEVQYTVRVPATAADPDGNATGNASTGILSFQVRAQAEPTSPISPGGEASGTFTVGVERPEPAAADTQPVEQAAPSPAFALVGLGLVALAAVLRRRA